jgi:alpha-1,2-mannosyltransferase
VTSQRPNWNPGQMGTPPAQIHSRPLSLHWLWAIGIAAIAFVVRLVPVLRGGGIFGIGNYDDAVYYAAATGLVHGQLPYQDFLLLHPPGMPLLLTPFALAAQLTSDSYGFAAARVSCMLLGAINAALIWKILKPVGAVAALFGALSYAVFYPAVYSDKSTLLECPATTALLIAILLLQPLINSGSISRWKIFLAGALVGLTITIKVWGIVTFLIVLAWLLLIRRFRAALQVLTGSAASALVICLPFFAVAPRAMWNQIVRDQLFRRGGNGHTILDRLDQMAGLGIVGRSYPAAITAAAVAGLLVCAALAWSYRETRLPVLLMLGQGAFLLITPTWFPHFAGFTAAPVTLAIGAAIGRLIDLVRARPAQIAVGLVIAGALVVYATGWTTTTFGRRFPQEFRSIAATAPGCVTSDDATTLIVSNTLSRNLTHGCRFIADLGGHSHDMAAAADLKVSRNSNREFQRFALDYLGSGSVSILVRYPGGRGFSARTTAVLDQWPLLASSGRYQVRQPVALGRSATRGSPKLQRR